MVEQVVIPLVLSEKLFNVIPAHQTRRGVLDRAIHQRHVPIIFSDDFVRLIVQIEHDADLIGRILRSRSRRLSFLIFNSVELSVALILPEIPFKPFLAF